MPNWCDNTISISGNADSVKKLKEFVGRPITEDGKQIENVLYSLANIKPSVPDSESLLGKDFESKGPDDWYHNNINSWGTKWDVYGNVYMNDYKEGDEFISYSFDSAWAPPTLTTKTLSEIFPELSIEHKYYESGCDFWGIETYAKGELISEVGGELDHKAWTTLGQECWNCSENEDIEDMYSDCPPVLEAKKKKRKKVKA